MIRRLAALALLALLVPSLITGCSGRGARKNASRVPRTAEDSLSWWRMRADSIESALGSLDKVERPPDPGTETAGYTAWFDSGAVRVVHETVDLGPRGSGSNRYYFERGEPRLTVEQGAVPADTGQRLVPLERAMLFVDFGRLVAATMTLDNVKTWVSGDEAAVVLSHARRLRATAQDARSSPGAGAPSGDTKPARR